MPRCRLLPEVFRDERRVLARCGQDLLRRRFARPGAELARCLVKFLALAVGTIVDAARIDIVVQNFRHAAGGPLGAACSRPAAQGGQAPGDLRAAAPGGVPLEDQPDDRRIPIGDQRPVPAAPAENVVTKWGTGRQVIPRPDGLPHPRLHPPFDGFILAPTHKQAKFEVLFVKFIVRVVGFRRGDNARAAALERLSDGALVLRVAPSQPLQLDDEHPLKQPPLHCLQQPLHLRPGRDGIPGDDLPVDRPDRKPPLLRQLPQPRLVPRQRFLNRRLGGVLPRFSQVHRIGFFHIKRLLQNAFCEDHRAALAFRVCEKQAQKNQPAAAGGEGDQRHYIKISLRKKTAKDSPCQSSRNCAILSSRDICWKWGFCTISSP